MAKKVVEVKYQDKEGNILVESTKFEYEKSTYHMLPGMFFLEDSKIEKSDTIKQFKDEIKKERDVVVKVERLLTAAPFKWLAENGYKKI